MVFTFDVNKHTAHLLPGSQLSKLPKYVSYFLGHNNNNPVQHDHFIWLEILVGSFCGILLLEGVFRNPTVFGNHHAPIIIASYGATAILCFNAKAAPLAQPRNVIFGHFSAALVGVCIEKLFSLTQTGRDHYYIGGALSVGLSSVVMSIINCVHPPAGASALLPFIDDNIREMSWWYLPTHLVSSVLIVAVACITGNIIGKYPVFWWYPGKKEAFKPEVEAPMPQSSKEDVASSTKEGNRVHITPKGISVPSHFTLDENEFKTLQMIQQRLQEPVEV